jgi:hypothetical protein
MAPDARAVARTADLPGEVPGARESDPAYPTVSLVDALYPAQTRAYLPPPLDGVATPGMWARLAEPLRRALESFWTALGLREVGRPPLWVTIHFGRIALNAHGCERLTSLLCERPADPALVVPATGLGRFPEWLELRRARQKLAALRALVRGAAARREGVLARLADRNPADLDTAALARGPLDDARWTDVLRPALHVSLQGETAEDVPLAAALGIEQRWATALGQRLVAARVLGSPAAVAYLTVEERVRAAHGAGEAWNDLAEQRSARVKRFAALDLPREFWGRPRAGG